MEERIDSGEIFGKSEKERKVDFATNEIIEKIKAAGIEVVTDKDEFNWTLRHLEEINITLKMLEEDTDVIQKDEKKEIEDLSTSKNDMESWSQSLEQKIILNSSNSQDIINNLNLLNNINSKLNGAEFLTALKQSFYLDDKNDSNYVHKKS